MMTAHMNSSAGSGRAVKHCDVGYFNTCFPSQTGTRKRILTLTAPRLLMAAEIKRSEYHTAYLDLLHVKMSGGLMSGTSVLADGTE